MKNFTVTILDTTGIQPYIFGSNRLRENIGASYLVSQATDTWARDALNTLKEDINQEVYPFKKHFNEDEDWKERKNKIIALREVLRQGSEATKQFLKNYRIKDEQLPLFPEFSGQSKDLAKKGWLNRVCGYFDAIEALEFYISLED